MMTKTEEAFEALEILHRICIYMAQYEQEIKFPNPSKELQYNQDITSYPKIWGVVEKFILDNKTI